MASKRPLIGEGFGNCDTMGWETAATQTAFTYCLCLLIVEAGRMRLVSKTLGDDGPLCHFHSADGEVFHVPEPALTAAQLTQLKTILRPIWLEEGGESG